jgi:hypothetical protein
MMPALDAKSSLPFDYIDKVSVVQYSAGLVGSNLVFLLGLISHVKP